MIEIIGQFYWGLLVFPLAPALVCVGAMIWTSIWP